MKFHAFAACAILALATLPAAQAQTPPPTVQIPTIQTPTGQAGQGGQGNGAARPQVQKFIARFQAANTTHDGRLTQAQAQAGHMPGIVKNFSAIDEHHIGYVTLQDIRAWRQARGAAAQPSPGDGVSVVPAAGAPTTHPYPAIPPVR